MFNHGKHDVKMFNNIRDNEINSVNNVLMMVLCLWSNDIQSNNILLPMYLKWNINNKVWWIKSWPDFKEQIESCNHFFCTNRANDITNKQTSCMTVKLFAFRKTSSIFISTLSTKSSRTIVIIMHVFFKCWEIITITCPIMISHWVVF